MGNGGLILDWMDVNEVDPFLAALNTNNNSLSDYSYADDFYGEDDDPLAPEQPPQLYIPDWNAFNAGANVAAAAANAVRGAVGNPCHGGGCGSGGGMMPMPPAPPPQPPIIIPPAPPQMPPQPVIAGGFGGMAPMPPAPPPPPPIIIPPPLPAPPVPPPPAPMIIPFPMPMPAPPPPPCPPAPLPPPPPPIIVLPPPLPPPPLPAPPVPPPSPPPIIPPQPPPQKEYIFIPPPPHFPPPLPPAPRCCTPRFPYTGSMLQSGYPSPLCYPPNSAQCLAQYPYIPQHQPSCCPPGGPTMPPPLPPRHGNSPCGLPLCNPAAIRGIQLPPPPLPPLTPVKDRSRTVVEAKSEKKCCCPVPFPMIPGVCGPPPPFAPSAIAANAFAAGVNAGRQGANHHENPFLNIPYPGALPGPPPSAHMMEMMMRKCAIECGKQRHSDGSMSPCPRHPHSGKGFWTAAGQFIPTEGWDQGGPPPFGTGNVPDIFGLGDFGDMQHTGGVPPWKCSPLSKPPCNPPNYNRVCDPTGMCGDDPPFWCEPTFQTDNVSVCGYGRPPEHAAMRRAKQQDYSGCDGGADHQPPHVCSYHIRRREYYGNRGARCCPLECFLGSEDPGRRCCKEYPACSCTRCCPKFPLCQCRSTRSPCPSDSSCDDPCFNKYPNDFKTPPVLVYRCDSHGPSFWNKICRWVFGAPSHHSLCEPDPCEVKNPDCFAPGPFIDPSTDPKRRYQHLKRYAHHMAKKWRHHGRKSRRHCDPTTFSSPENGWECEPTAGVTVVADKRHPPQIFINSPMKRNPTPCDSVASSWSSSDSCGETSPWRMAHGIATATNVLPLSTRGLKKNGRSSELDIKSVLFDK